MARPRLPRINCTGCPREQVAVGRADQRIYPHKHPKTGEPCPDSGRQVDLYGEESQ
ncbi:hypothetical protein [Micromonospora sp. WMMD737]|uniref:hypothetical protein n=1 Tax=Micromonospora sp. WMMD737 TaxID=3404113 RepID=UPI003B93235D